MEDTRGRCGGIGLSVCAGLICDVRRCLDTGLNHGLRNFQALISDVKSRLLGKLDGDQRLPLPLVIGTLQDDFALSQIFFFQL